jgi:hypothetical protein
MPNIRIGFPLKTVEDIDIPEDSFFFLALDNFISDGKDSGIISLDELCKSVAMYTLYAEDPSEQGLYRKLVDAIGVSTDNDELSSSYVD